MLNNSEREEIRSWLKSSRNYDQGLLLLSKYTKNRLLLKKKNIPIEKIVFELNKFVGNEVVLKPVVKQVVSVPQPKTRTIQKPTQIEIKKKRILKFVKNQLQLPSSKFKNWLKISTECIMIYIILVLQMILILFKKGKKY